MYFLLSRLLNSEQKIENISHLHKLQIQTISAKKGCEVMSNGEMALPDPNVLAVLIWLLFGLMTKELLSKLTLVVSL